MVFEKSMFIDVHKNIFIITKLFSTPLPCSDTRILIPELRFSLHCLLWKFGIQIVYMLYMTEILLGPGLKIGVLLGL